MIYWSYAVSWSKFKLALSCPKRLQFEIEERPPSVPTVNCYERLGQAVQKTFELFYRHGLWKFEKARTPEVFKKITDRVLELVKHSSVTYPSQFSEADLERETYELVEKGRQLFQELGLLDKPLETEAAWRATVGALRLYGKMDFVHEESSGGTEVSVYDGKGNLKKDADPRQLLFYALILRASGKHVKEAALMYWRHGKEAVDVSERALVEFMVGDFARGEEVFRRLKRGVENLTATPSPEQCKYCQWRKSCEDSAYYTGQTLQESPAILTLES